MNFVLEHLTLLIAALFVLAGLIGIYVGLVTDASKDYPPVEAPDDGFVFWPACPECGGPVGCIGRFPKNAVPAEIYRFACNEHGHPSAFSHREIMAMQERRRVEVLT